MSESRSHEYQKRYNEINHLINKGIKLAAKGSVILFDRYPLEKGDEQINKYPKPDIVIYADDSIPYKEDLPRVKKSIWEHLNKPEYA